MLKQKLDDSKFIVLLTLALIGISIWIFSAYFHYILVAAVLAMATSQVYTNLSEFMKEKWGSRWLGQKRRLIVTILLTCFFLIMIFGPLLYFVSVTYDQLNSLDLEHVKNTALVMVDKTIDFLDEIPLLQEPLTHIRQEGISFISGPAIGVAFGSVKGIAIGAGGLFIQIVWILVFYSLFNFYGKSILRFISALLPLSTEHEQYLYRECTGTVSVVLYGALFNMIAQGIAFGMLMVFIGNNNAGYLGVLAGFCSVIPIVGAALVYVPVIALELLAGHFIQAIIILLFAWIIMGFVIDNILRLFFIGFLKNLFGFEYAMNEILVLLAILAGISSFGFWGLIIGPSVLALTLAAANLYSVQLQK